MTMKKFLIFAMGCSLAIQSQAFAGNNCQPIQVKKPSQPQPTNISQTKNPTAVRNLMDAVYNNNLAQVQTILASNQVAPTDGDQNSNSPLFFSVAKSPDITRALLDYGFNPNMGSEPEICTSFNRSLRLVQILSLKPRVASSDSERRLRLISRPTIISTMLRTT
jgi:hypothetical protein